MGWVVTFAPDTARRFPHPALHQRLIMALVSAALFIEILDGTIITTALPSMARSFHTIPVALDIGVSAYLLTVGVFVPASGWVADRFGAACVCRRDCAVYGGLCAVRDGAGADVIRVFVHPAGSRRCADGTRGAAGGDAPDPA